MTQHRDSERYTHCCVPWWLVPLMGSSVRWMDVTVCLLMDIRIEPSPCLLGLKLPWAFLQSFCRPVFAFLGVNGNGVTGAHVMCMWTLKSPGFLLTDCAVSIPTSSSWWVPAAPHSRRPLVWPATIFHFGHSRRWGMLLVVFFKFKICIAV